MIGTAYDLFNNKRVMRLFNITSEEDAEITADKHVLDDGIYSVDDDTTIYKIEENKKESVVENEIIEFIKEYPSFVVASAYETFTTFLISERPDKWNGEVHGSGFNYGSTNLIKDCPKNLLILAEND